jgi:hypothetical protein
LLETAPTWVSEASVARERTAVGGQVVPRRPRPPWRKGGGGLWAPGFNGKNGTCLGEGAARGRVQNLLLRRDYKMTKFSKNILPSKGVATAINIKLISKFCPENRQRIGEILKPLAPNRCGPVDLRAALLKRVARWSAMRLNPQKNRRPFHTWRLHARFITSTRN